MRSRTGSGRPANRGHLRRRRSALPGAIERAEVRADAASRIRGLADRLRPFATCFTAAVWRHVPVLVAGALLGGGGPPAPPGCRAPGLVRSAGCAARRRVLTAARCSARAVAHRLLLVLVATSVPDGPVVLGIDDTIERR